MTDGLDSRAPLWPVALWPVALLGLAQAGVIGWLVGAALNDHWPVIVPGGGAGHGSGHGGGPAGPAPIASEQAPHYLGLVAFAAHALLPAVAMALAVTRRLVVRCGWGHHNLLGRLAFAAAIGVAGAVAAACTSWVAVRSSTGRIDGLPEVAVVSATGAFRYSFLMALVVALFGEAWRTRKPRQQNPAPVPVELVQ
jgi:hypothetical protein